MRFIVLLMCFCVSAVVEAREFTVATVDMQLLFKEYPGTAPAQKKYNAFVADKKKELSDDKDTLEEMQNQLTSKKIRLSNEQKKEKLAEFQAQAQDYESEKSDIETELADKEQDMTQTLVQQIDGIVAGVAQAQGIDLVLDSNDAVGIPNGKDLTQVILEKFSSLKPSSSSSN